MGDLVILLVCGLFMPATMLIMGLTIWKTRPPFNDIFGYRTGWSQKNETLWDMGQELFGRYCTITYAAFFILHLISGIVPIVFHMDKYTAELISTPIYLAEFTALFAVIGAVDGKLKRAFKTDGDKFDNTNE